MAQEELAINAGELPNKVCQCRSNKNTWWTLAEKALIELKQAIGVDRGDWNVRYVGVTSGNMTTNKQSVDRALHVAYDECAIFILMDIRYALGHRKLKTGFDCAAQTVLNKRTKFGALRLKVL